MKKILSVFIICLVLLSSFCLVASADEFAITESDGMSTLDPDVSITFSQDFKTLYFGDVTYSAFPNEKIPFYLDYSIDNLTILTKEQKKDVEEVSLLASKNGEAIEASIYYNYGANLNVYYFRDDYIKEYNRISSIDHEDLYIVFSHFYDTSEEISVKTTQKLLKGEKVKLEIDEVFLTDWFEVSAKSDKLNLLVQKGTLFNYDDEYYYLDFSEANINQKSFDPYTYKGDAYKITDPALIQQIEEALAKYYQEDYGIFFNDDFTESVSKIFITLLFAVIPFAIFVLTLILGIKAKKIYKKLYFTACILSASELITLAVILLII